MATRKPKGQPAAELVAPPEQPKMSLVNRQTLADNVYEQLRNAIIRGRLRDGFAIKQVEFAAQMGVSRVPLREALRRLQAERLVVAEPFQCFVVTSLSPDQVLELLDLREELEVFALKRTLTSPACEQRLRNAKEAAKALTLNQDGETWLAADREFHRALNGETTAAAAIIEDIRERVNRYLYTSSAGVSRRREILKDHAAIVAALQAQDEKRLEEAIRHHLQGTRRHLQSTSLDSAPEKVDQPLLLPSV